MTFFVVALYTPDKRLVLWNTLNHPPAKPSSQLSSHVHLAQAITGGWQVEPQNKSRKANAPMWERGEKKMDSAWKPQRIWSQVWSVPRVWGLVKGETAAILRDHVHAFKHPGCLSSMTRDRSGPNGYPSMMQRDLNAVTDCCDGHMQRAPNLHAQSTSIQMYILESR